VSDEREPILRRITVEYGRKYVYLMFTDASGKVLDEEVWKQPYRLDTAEALDESQDCYDVLYSHCQDTVLFTASSGEDGGTVDSPQED
jgi:hypothetical protein